MINPNNHLNDPNVDDPNEHVLETKIVHLEQKGDSEEHDEFSEIEEEKRDQTDYSGFSKTDFASSIFRTS